MGQRFHSTILCLLFLLKISTFWDKGYDNFENITELVGSFGKFWKLLKAFYFLIFLFNIQIEKCDSNNLKHFNAKLHFTSILPINGFLSGHDAYMSCESLLNNYEAWDKGGENDLLLQLDFTTYVSFLKIETHRRK